MIPNQLEEVLGVVFEPVEERLRELTSTHLAVVVSHIENDVDSQGLHNCISDEGILVEENFHDLERFDRIPFVFWSS